MRLNGSGASGLLKAFLAAVAAAGVVIGLALPLPHHKERPPPRESQFATFDFGAG
jgi:hypothetical protein